MTHTEKSPLILERKRVREKQRRDLLKSGLDDLAIWLAQIDPSLHGGSRKKEDGGDAASMSGTSSWATDVNFPKTGLDTMTNRVELIQCTIKVLKKLHQENETRKQILRTLGSSKGLNRHVESDLVGSADVLLSSRKSGQSGEHARCTRLSGHSARHGPVQKSQTADTKLPPAASRMDLGQGQEQRMASIEVSLIRACRADDHLESVVSPWKHRHNAAA